MGEKKDSSIGELEIKLQSLREDLVSKESGSNDIVSEMNIEKNRLMSKIEELEKLKVESERKGADLQKELDDMKEKRNKLEEEVLEHKVWEGKYNDLSIELKDSQERNN